MLFFVFISNIIITNIINHALLNKSQAQWARYGETASEALKEAKPRKMFDDELEKIIKEPHFEKKNRIVKKDRKVRYKGRNYYISKKLKGTTIEIIR